MKKLSISSALLASSVVFATHAFAQESDVDSQDESQASVFPPRRQPWPVPVPVPTPVPVPVPVQNGYTGYYCGTATCAFQNATVLLNVYRQPVGCTAGTLYYTSGIAPFCAPVHPL